MSQLNVGTLRPSEAFTVPLQSTSVRNNTNHAVGSIIYNTDTNAAQVLTANDGWLNLGKGKVIATGGTVSEPGNACPKLSAQGQVKIKVRPTYDKIRIMCLR